MTDFLISTIASNVILLGVLGYLSKSLITQWLNKDIERFKADVKANVNEELEAYKSKLEKERITLQVAYSGIFSKQADAVLHIYKLLVKLDKNLKLSIQMMETEVSQNYLVYAVKSWAEFSEYFDENRILLPEDVVATIIRIQIEVFNSTLEYRKLSLQSLTEMETNELKKLLHDKDKAASVASEFPALKATLEARFRELIGSAITP